MDKGGNWLMRLSKQDVRLIKTTDSNRKFLNRGYSYYAYRGLIISAIIFILFLAPFIVWRVAWPYYVLIFVLLLGLFLSYLLIIGIALGFTKRSVRTSNKRIQKLNVGQKEYEDIVNKPNPYIVRELMGGHQIEQLYDLPDFNVNKNSSVYEKILNRLNRRKLGKLQQSESLTIYKSLLHYWNKHFSPINNTHRSSPRKTLDTSFGRQHIFDSNDNEKVKIENVYYIPNFVGDYSLTSDDTISYVYKRNENVYKGEDKDIGILWNLSMPYIKEFDSDITNGFYLIPAGEKPKMMFDYHYHASKEGYDIYIHGKMLNKELDEVLAFIRPFTERNWDISVQYSTTYLYVYLPEFLADITDITSESELYHVCECVNRFYSLLKRSFIWRYGELEKWNEGE